MKGASRSPPPPCAAAFATMIDGICIRALYSAVTNQVHAHEVRTVGVDIRRGGGGSGKVGKPPSRCGCELAFWINGRGYAQLSLLDNGPSPPASRKGADFSDFMKILGTKSRKADNSASGVHDYRQKGSVLHPFFAQTGAGVRCVLNLPHLDPAASAEAPNKRGLRL